MRANSIQFHSRMVGLTYVVTVLIGLFNTFYIKPNTYNPDTLLASELWFRSAQVLDLTMFALVLWMALAIYLSIRHLNAALAKFVFAFRLVEVVLGCVIVLVSYLSLLALKKSGLSSAFNDAQARALYTLALDLANIGWAVHLCFMAIGALIYFYLLHASRVIPRWLSCWGFFTYATVFAGFLLVLLLPSYPERLMLVMAPGALFEFTFGCWMLVKGSKPSSTPTGV